MLSEDVIDEITTYVRSGFYESDHLTRIFCEEMYAPGELSIEEVRAAINTAFSEWEEEKKSWGDTTDCDRLDDAFAALNAKGIIAIQNAGFTQSDGYDDFLEAYERSTDKSAVLGYCYYHGQDLERAVRGGGLFLAFGPAVAAEEESKGPEIGRIVQEELERVGLGVVWDGSFAKRISIPDFDWKKR
ncbi:MAG: hypothetical protein QNI99_09890 [Woeseiaceae bacterium]|nr:hypothetical protein [Woeseiaceae bacterium]